MKVRVYKDKQKEWRWRLSATNGNVLADSGEGYKRKVDCESALETVTHAELMQMVKNDLQLLVDAIAQIRGK